MSQQDAPIPVTGPVTATVGPVWLGLFPPLPRGNWPRPVKVGEDAPSTIKPVCTCATDAWEPHAHCWRHGGRCCHCDCPATERPT